jgi:hypothetical protein
MSVTVEEILGVDTGSTPPCEAAIAPGVTCGEPGRLLLRRLVISGFFCVFCWESILRPVMLFGKWKCIFCGAPRYVREI